MAFETLRQLLTAKDRIAARAEKAFREAVSTPLPNEFKVVVYVNENDPTKNQSQGGSELEGYGFCRARSQAGHNDMLRDPVEITDVFERNSAIQSHPQAYYSLDIDNFPQNGDVWSATFENGIIRLNSLVERRSDFKFKNKESSREARENFKNKTKKLNDDGSVAEDLSSEEVRGFIEDLEPGNNIYDTSKKLLKFISSKEGSYDASNNGTDRQKNIRNSIPGKSWVKRNKVTNSQQTRDQKLLSTMTIGEIVQLQKGSNPYLYPNASRKRTLFAVGAYQIIPETMGIALKDSGLSTSDVFTPENQDKLGLALIYGTKRPKLRDYLLGKNNVTLNDAHNDFAEEWASVPRPDGKTAYEGTGNKAGHTAKEVSDLLQEVRKLNIEGSNK